MMAVSVHPVTSKRLLVINPNTNAAVTERVRRAAIDTANAATSIEALNPAEGPFAIEGDLDRVAAVPHVVSIIRAAAGKYDGYVLACFDDIGIAEARALTNAPVISMAEAAIRSAAAGFQRFGIVTTVEAALPSIRALLDHYGVAERCSVYATGIGVAETADRTLHAEQALQRTMTLLVAEGAQAIILGSGAYAGRREELAGTFDITVIDGLESAISHCEELDGFSTKGHDSTAGVFAMPVFRQA